MIVEVDFSVHTLLNTCEGSW